jgi:hypothetical protein
MHGPACFFWANLTPFSLQPKSDNQVFYTGDSSNSIAWLEMGNRSAADAQFDLAFTAMGSTVIRRSSFCSVWIVTNEI